MLIAGVVCLCAALTCLVFGLRALARPGSVDPGIRALAPAQLAAAFLLAAGASVAFLAPPGGALVVAICVAGAVGTVLAGSWYAARYLARRGVPEAQCGGSCAGCSLPCG